MTKAIDFTKPVQDKRGNKIRILATDVGEDFPVVGALEDGSIFTWTTEGIFYADGAESLRDLENCPEVIERFLNVYPRDGHLVSHDSLKQANAAAASNRLGIIKLTFTDDKLTAAEVLPL